MLLLERLTNEPKSGALVDTLQFIINATKYKDYLKELDQFEER
jgi:hypothetical protein